jgi:hypothetical protein
MRSVPWAAVCAVAVVVGCGKSDPHNRQAVLGTVSIDGKMIPYGNIEFVPAENQPTTVTLEIKDGKFTVDQKGGIAPGKYTVRVQGFDAPPPPPGDAPGVSPTGPMPKTIVPEKFGAMSKEQVTIKAGDKNELTIELKSK